MEKQRIPLSEADALAAEVVGLFDPFCEIVKVLGSIRRRKSEVGDIEIGVMPRVVVESEPGDLFGDTQVSVNAQLRECKRLIAAGVLGLRPNKNGVPTCGEGIQFLTYKGFALDVFGCLEPDAWGVTVLIRTGSGDFNQRIVRQRVQGGTVLPMGMRFDGGRLIDRGVPVVTRTERDVFEAIGMDWVRPEDRHS